MGSSGITKTFLWIKKVIEWFKKKYYRLVLLVLAVIAILIAIIYFQHNKIVNLRNDVETQIKLRDALIDSVHFYRNERNELVAEKLTIQETVKNLEKIYNQLTSSQKELIDRVKELDRKNNIIAAALIKTNVTLDSLVAEKENVIVDTTKKTITFQDSTKNLQYEFLAFPVLPAYPDVKPSLTFKKFSLPNTQFIEFHYKDDKKKDYPISFSVTNTNDYFKTINVESYAIPTLEKKTSWDKFSGWMKNNGKTVMYIGIGGVAGGTAVYLLNGK